MWRKARFLNASEKSEVRLVQLDVAVVTTGRRRAGSSGRSLRWATILPRIPGQNGAGWIAVGQRSLDFPAVPKSESILARESVLNRKDRHAAALWLRPQTGRAGGHKQSSCLSCHGGAYCAQAGVARHCHNHSADLRLHWAVHELFIGERAVL